MSVTYHPNGDIYIGEFEDGKQHCEKGSYIWSFNNSIYEGPFVEGQMIGKGKITHYNSMYEGDVVNGQYHGEGKYIQYANNKSSGKLKRIEEGTFKHNKLNGKGKTTIYNS